MARIQSLEPPSKLTSVCIIRNIEWGVSELLKAGTDMGCGHFNWNIINRQKGHPDSHALTASLEERDRTHVERQREGGGGMSNHVVHVTLMYKRSF